MKAEHLSTDLWCRRQYKCLLQAFSAVKGSSQVAHVSSYESGVAVRLCPCAQQRCHGGARTRLGPDLGSGCAQARSAYVLDGRCGMLLLAASKQGLARSVHLLAGADVWSAHKDLIATASPLGSHCIHNALQCSELDQYGKFPNLLCDLAATGDAEVSTFTRTALFRQFSLSKRDL